MLKYKGFVLDEKNIEKDGAELLISIEAKSKKYIDNKDGFYDDIEKSIKHWSRYIGIEFNVDNVADIRNMSNELIFTFNLEGVDNLINIYYKLKNDFPNEEVLIEVYLGDFVFGENNEYNSDLVTLEEFLDNIEYM